MKSDDQKDHKYRDRYMPKNIAYFKINTTHDGKNVTKHFVRLAGLTEDEKAKAISALVDLVLQDAKDDSDTKQDPDCSR